MNIHACTCGCAVLLCLVCLFDLACFFLSSFSSLIKTCVLSEVWVEYSGWYSGIHV